jgi:hypothetical protein
MSLNLEDERGSVETVDVRNLDNPSILPRVFLLITAAVDNKRRNSDGEHDGGCSGARHGIAIGICFHSYKAQGTASATFFFSLVLLSPNYTLLNCNCRSGFRYEKTDASHREIESLEPDLWGLFHVYVLEFNSKMWVGMVTCLSRRT